MELIDNLYREQAQFSMNVAFWALIVSGLAAITLACLRKKEYAITTMGVGVGAVLVHVLFAATQYVKIWTGPLALFPVLIVTLVFIYLNVLLVRVIRAIH